MKQIAKLIGCLVILLSLTVPAQAKGPANVSETTHNLSAAWHNYTANVDEVCVFCHTPHGGSLTGPLWNHVLPDANSFTHYNSVTLSTTIDAARDIGPESLLCMGCHDGSVAVDHLINNPNSLNGAPIKIEDKENIDIQLSFGGNIKRIGASHAIPLNTGDLSDDHPISFSYKDVLDDYTARSKSGLREIAMASTWETEGVRFFGSDFRVECSSCHDPHVSYDQYATPQGDEDYRPFLIMPNTGSNLCLACHDK